MPTGKIGDWDARILDGGADAGIQVGPNFESRAEARYSRDAGMSYSGGSKTNIFRAGVDVNATTIKLETTYGDGIGTLGVEGPNAGVDLGVQIDTEDPRIGAMVEASLCKAEVSLGPVFLEANLNATTGVKLNSDGFKANVVGFGLTLGVGGKFSLDTPFGSFGGKSPGATMNLKHTAENRNRLLVNERY